MIKYYFIYLFSNLFSLISLNGPRWAKWGPPRAGAPALAEPGMWDSPTLLGWQGWLSPGAYIRRGTPGLLIHPINSRFLLDLVIPFVGVAPRRMRVLSPP